MRKEDLKNWTRDMMKDKVLKQEELIEQWQCDIGELSVKLAALNKENSSLKCENQALKQHIKDMEDACDGSCFSDYEDLPFGDDEYEKDELIAELQDRHQQDCIKINQLHVTIDTLVDKYARIRKTVGMD